ncbi:MAG TPA: DUF3857 domain-containing protein, partial [Puia sp.]
MRIFFLTLFILGLIVPKANSQTPSTETEHWLEKPTVSPLNNKFNQEPAYTVLDKTRIEFIDDKDNNVEEYYTLHKIIHLNDDHGIENFNKIYINVNNFSDVSAIRARTILPGGKIVELDKSNIKDLKDEDGALYKIFAFEGLEKGCDIEYFYTKRMETSYFGKVKIQDNFPIIETHFELICPKRLVFDTKLYHCQTDTRIDSLPGDKARLTMHFNEISGLEDEKYASYHVNLARIEYKLSYNNVKSRGERLFTWNELAKRIFEMYGTYSEKELKKAADLTSNNQWDRLSGDSLKIIAVENYIKKNISFRKDLEGDDVSSIEAIIKSKTANAVGLMRIYGALYETLQVEFQFVLTADRDEAVIDRSFENWDNCDYQLFYFPSVHNFLAPTKVEYRYPWIFPSWAGGTALFCKNITVGSMHSAIAEIKSVPLKNFQLTYNNLDSKLSLNAAMDSLVLDMKFIFGGYEAAIFRSGFDFLTEEQKQSAIKEYSKRSIGTETIFFSELQNTALEDGNSQKPFILHIKVKSGDLLER